MGLSVIILTFNAESTIGATLESARLVSDDIHVVDSGSTDGTLAIVERLGAKILNHPFESYGAQRNWAIATCPLKYEWELHLDADERLTPELASAIKSLAAGGFAGPAVGYFIPRLVHFLGSPIRHGGMYPIWHMRLFRHGHGRCEDRRYDQHFLVDGATDRIPHPMIDDIRMSLAEWVTRHNRWAEAEANEMEAIAAPAAGDDGRALVQPNLAGNPVERKRALRASYNAMPLFVRPFLLFFYRYFLRFGFLDGRAGLVFYVLQTFWFRFLVDAKLFERQLSRKQRP